MARTESTAFEKGNPFDEFQIGDQVEHPKWGVGTILFRSGAGEKAKVIVVFPEEGQKKLALKYARLKRLQEAKPSIAPAPAPAPEPVEKVLAKEPGEPDEETEELEELEPIEDLGDEDEILPREDEEKEIAFGKEEEEDFEDLEEKEDSEGH